MVKNVHYRVGDKWKKCSLSKLIRIVAWNQQFKCPLNCSEHGRAENFLNGPFEKGLLLKENLSCCRTA